MISFGNVNRVDWLSQGCILKLWVGCLVFDKRLEMAKLSFSFVKSYFHKVLFQMCLDCDSIGVSDVNLALAKHWKPETN